MNMKGMMMNRGILSNKLRAQKRKRGKELFEESKFIALLKSLMEKRRTGHSFSPSLFELLAINFH